MPKDFWATFSKVLSIVVSGQEVGLEPIINPARGLLRYAFEWIKKREETRSRGLHFV